MAYSRSIPKRRWLQFKLRTLLIVVTIVALSLGWWQHRRYCLARARVHNFVAAFCLIQGIDFPAGWEEEFPLRPALSIAEQERLKSVAQQHHETSEAYRLAVWLPWLRWSIAEPSIELESETRPSP